MIFSATFLKWLWYACISFTRGAFYSILKSWYIKYKLLNYQKRKGKRKKIRIKFILQSFDKEMKCRRNSKKIIKAIVKIEHCHHFVINREISNLYWIWHHEIKLLFVYFQNFLLECSNSLSSFVICSLFFIFIYIFGSCLSFILNFVSNFYPLSSIYLLYWIFAYVSTFVAHFSSFSSLFVLLFKLNE